ILRKGRKHADDRVWLVIHAKNLAHHRGIAAKAAQPIFVAEQQNRWRALFFVVGSEVPPEKRFGAEHLKKIPRNYARFDLFWFRTAEQDELHIVVFDDGVQAAILASIVEHFGYRNIGASRSLAGQALAKQ